VFLKMRRRIRLIKEQYGQAMVEMALILPLLLLLLIGTIEIGRVFGSHMVVGDLARQGARYGIVGYNDAQINNLLLSERAWLNESSLSITITPGFSSRKAGDPLNVTVNYSTSLLTPFFSGFFPDPVVLSSQCTMRVE